MGPFEFVNFKKGKIKNYEIQETDYQFLKPILIFKILIEFAYE